MTSEWLLCHVCMKSAIFVIFIKKVRQTWHFNNKKTNKIVEFVCLSLSAINSACAQTLLRMERRYFLNKRQKRGQQIFVDTADKVMIPVAFCFWATEEDLRLEHIPWLTWWDVIGSSSRACSQYYGVFRLPSSARFPELTAVCPPPWHFLKNKRHLKKIQVTVTCV